MMLSHWERESWTGYTDYLVVGAGIVGLSAALRLKELYPQAEVKVLERGALPTGASTKNAGFACFGSVSELLDDLANLGQEAVLKLVQQRWEGLTRLRARLGDTALHYESVGGFELFRPADQGRFSTCEAAIGQLNALLAPIIGEPDVFRLANGRMPGFGFAGVSHLIENRCEGLLDTGRMMRALLHKAQSAGVLVLTATEVVGLEPGASSVEVATANHWRFQAGQVIVATNGFARQLLPKLMVEPARAQVLITKPIPRLKLKGGFHYDAGYYYFRNVGERVLFGGGRNLDFEAERTDKFALTAQVQDKLEDLLREMILPGQSFEVDHRWVGIMGVGESKMRILRKVHPRLTCAVRLGGMGVAIGSLLGDEVAEFVTEN
ncbi:MAG TPA: FAD-binding oxidoreductase [Bacteroidetes bacterium]|nr:FAD-binding oxidoreductase [Bacteroidota bacterium]